MGVITFERRTTKECIAGGKAEHKQGTDGPAGDGGVPRGRVFLGEVHLFLPFGSLPAESDDLLLEILVLVEEHVHAVAEMFGFLTELCVFLESVAFVREFVEVIGLRFGLGHQYFQAGVFLGELLFELVELAQPCRIPRRVVRRVYRRRG